MTKKVIIVCLIFASCISPPGKRALSATYIDGKECGKIVFYKDGQFVYYFSPKGKSCINAHSIPDNAIGNLGNYYFESESSLVPGLSVRSAHHGIFEFRFSEDLRYLFVKHLWTGEEEKWEKK